MGAVWIVAERVACPALYRVVYDGDVDWDVCGTYATKDEDGVIRCEAGHTTRPTAQAVGSSTH